MINCTIMFCDTLWCFIVLIYTFLTQMTLFEHRHVSFRLFGEVVTWQVIFVLKPLHPPPPPLCSPLSLFMQMNPLQTDSGFHYANSFPIKTLSKQIFSEQQKEEVVTGPRRVNSVRGWTSSMNVCIVLCGQGDLCKHTALPSWSSPALIRRTHARVFASISI